MNSDLSKFKIIGNCAAMRALAEWVFAAAKTWDTILITGERGTGKELLAHAIHRLGPTRGAEPVIVDCASLHPATVESVLFGHERGSFTGAVHRHTGLLETAHEGTLFLDEISHLPLPLQGRFLRFLEERTVLRIGALQPTRIRTRVIAASNRDLALEVEKGRFLPDLYDRLHVLHTAVPPLRERGEDVFLLLEKFHGKPGTERFDAYARLFLKAYPFPGNVRELRNLCRRLEVFCPEGTITAECIREQLQGEPRMPPERAAAETEAVRAAGSAEGRTG